MESVAAAISKSSNAAQSLNHSKSMFQKLFCPHIESDEEACGFDSNLKTIIIHLNDEHKWSREDIADWLDTLENQPVFYPDIRTDDEKIEDAKKEQELVSLSLGWTKSPAFPYGVIAESASVQFGLTADANVIVLYNSDGSINQTFTGPGCSATWEVKFTPYGGASYVCVYNNDGSKKYHYPKPKSVTV